MALQFNKGSSNEGHAVTQPDIDEETQHGIQAVKQELESGEEHLLTSVARIRDRQSSLYVYKKGKLAAYKAAIQAVSMLQNQQAQKTKGDSMLRSEESKVRAVFRKHIEAAVQELSNAEGDLGSIALGFWPDGVEERLAEMATQAVAIMTESSILTEANCNGR